MDIYDIFDVDGKKLVPGKMCYAIPWLKKIMDEYPDCYNQVYSYLFFTLCPTGNNPYINIEDENKDDIIFRDLGRLNFSLEDKTVLTAFDNLKKLYETPTERLRRGAKRMLDEMGETLLTAKLTFGKEGNETGIRGMMKEIAMFTENYMKLEIMAKEEQSKVRGGRSIPYHQLQDYKETKTYE